MNLFFEGNKFQPENKIEYASRGRYLNKSFNLTIFKWALSIFTFCWASRISCVCAWRPDRQADNKMNQPPFWLIRYPGVFFEWWWFRFFELREKRITSSKRLTMKHCQHNLIYDAWWWCGVMIYWAQGLHILSLLPWKNFIFARLVRPTSSPQSNHYQHRFFALILVADLLRPRLSILAPSSPPRFRNLDSKS